MKHSRKLMMIFDAKTIILERFKQRTLASFYIIVHREKQVLRKWVTNLLSEIAPREHPDIVYISRENEEYYHAADGILEELIRFNTYPPLNLPWKWLFLEGPHLIPHNSVHKMLKLLEETLPNSSIFFLHYSGQELLKTLEGRSLAIRLPTSLCKTSLPYEQGDFKACLRFLAGEECLCEALEEIKVKDSKSSMQFFLNHSLKNFHQGPFYCNLLESIKHFQDSKAHNNSFKERFSLLLYRLRDTSLSLS